MPPHLGVGGKGDVQAVDHGARGKGGAGDGIDVGLTRAGLVDRKFTGGGSAGKAAEVLLGQRVGADAVGLVLGHDLQARHGAVGIDADHELDVAVVALSGGHVEDPRARVGLCTRS